MNDDAVAVINSCILDLELRGHVFVSAAAASTASAAKENQKRSEQMFKSTEELMKFQFLSMSMSYFSSLNMLSNLREVCCGAWVRVPCAKTRVVLTV